MEPTDPRAALSISELAKSLGVGRDQLYEDIRKGRLRAKRIGLRRTIITAEAARAYIDSLPDLELGTGS